MKIFVASLLIIWGMIAVGLCLNTFVELPFWVKVILSILPFVLLVLFLIYLQKVWDTYIKESERMRDLGLRAKIALNLLEKKS